MIHLKCFTATGLFIVGVIAVVSRRISFASAENLDNEIIKLAGVFDLTNYDWGPDLIAVTERLINDGEWGIITPDTAVRIAFDLADTNCDQTTAINSYWEVRERNGNQPVHGVIGCRCSSASMGLARISQLEQVPHVSQASNSVLLSNAEEFPFFSRLVPPNNEYGEGKGSVPTSQKSLFVA